MTSVQQFCLTIGQKIRDGTVCGVFESSTWRGLKCARLTINHPEAVYTPIQTDSWHRMAAIIRSKLSLSEIVCYLFGSGKLRDEDGKWHRNRHSHWAR